MIKIPGLNTDLGLYWLTGDLLGFKFNKMSKNMLFLPFLTTSNILIFQQNWEAKKLLNAHGSFMVVRQQALTVYNIVVNIRTILATKLEL